VLFRMYVYVVRTCIRCGTNVYLGGTKMGGTKRRWYEKTGIRRVYNKLFTSKQDSVQFFVWRGLIIPATEEQLSPKHVVQ